MTTLLTASYPLPPSIQALELRQKSASLISRLLATFGTSYSTLSGRVAKTLLKALKGDSQAIGSTASNNIGTRLGALIGLKSIGKYTAIKALIHDSGLRGISDLSENLEDSGKLQVIETIIDTLTEILPAATEDVDVPATDLEDVCGSFVSSAIELNRPEISKSIVLALKDEDIESKT